MRLNAYVWVLIGPYASLRMLMGPYKSLCVFMKPYRSLCIYVDSNGLFYHFFIVLIGFYKSLCVLMDSNWSLWDTISLFTFALLGTSF